MSGSDRRRVSVAVIPEGDEYGIGPCEVLIERFGDRAPTVAFRRLHHQVWSRPFPSEGD